MNVTCTGCPAKYSVPDEKVRGKKVRITCKHCGTNLIVDGSVLGATAAHGVLAQAEPEPAPAPFSAAAPKATATPILAPAPAAEPAPRAGAKPIAPIAAEATWLVGFIDERQEQHSTSQLVELYKASKIDDETLVWKDGMDDWRSPFDVPEIAVVMKQRGVTRRAPSFALRLATDDEPTVVGRLPLEHLASIASASSEVVKPATAKSPVLPAVAAARQSTPEIKPPASAIRQSASEIKPSAAIRQSTPEIKPALAKPVVAAARRTEKRPEVDLFGDVANAGSEADASLDFGAAEEPVHKMTGARNESSVLFTLDALTKPDAKDASQKKTRDKQKEKDASALLFGDSAPDSLLNMGGGGGLAALAAPDFTKPVSVEPAPIRPNDPVEVPNGAPGKKKSGVLIGVTVGLAAAAGIAFLVMAKKPPEKAVDGTTTDTNAAAPTPPATPAAPATESPATPTPSAASEVASAAPAASAPAASAAAAQKPVPDATPATPAVAAIANRPTEKPAEAKKSDAAPVPTPAAPATAADFDKSAAIAALSAAAANAASCKKPDGPTGGGKASVTFAPSGRATNSTVTGAFAGTDVGGCVARVFRAAKIPPFAGDPVTVSKSFSIE